MRFAHLILFISSVALAGTGQGLGGCSRISGKPPLMSKPAPVGPGLYKYTLRFGGYDRMYLVYVPKTYTGQTPVAAVLSLHGGGGSAADHALTDGMDAKADREGFLSVHPQGISPTDYPEKFATWNAGNCCGLAMEQKVDDVGYISAVIESLASKFNLDRKRVFSTGFSNGSIMTIRLACELSNKIAAIAPIGSVNGMTTCRPERPVPMMYFHGTSDPCAPFNGGPAGDCWSQFVGTEPGTLNGATFDSVPDFVADWRSIDGVGGSARITYQNGKATCGTWGGSGVPEVTACYIQGAGHTWPGGMYGGPCTNAETPVLCLRFVQIVGVLSHDIQATDEMWTFFQRNPMK